MVATIEKNTTITTAQVKATAITEAAVKEARHCELCGVLFARTGVRFVSWSAWVHRMAGSVRWRIGNGHARQVDGIKAQFEEKAKAWRTFMQSNGVLHTTPPCCWVRPRELVRIGLGRLGL